MKKLTLITLIFFSSICYSQTFQNIGIAPDKQLHFAGGAFSSVWGYSLSYYKNEDRKKAKFWGVVVPLVVGTIKELSDINKTGFDVADLAYTVGGGVVMTYSIDFLVGRRIHREKVLKQRSEEIVALEELEAIERQLNKQSKSKL